MRRHPANPASVYRPATEGEAMRHNVQQFVRAIRAGAPHPWRRVYMALASRKLPRNYFTTARPPTRDEIIARMRARASEDIERRRLDHIRAEMRYGT